MSVLRRLFYFSSLAFVFACIMARLHPQTSQLTYLRLIGHGITLDDSSRFMDQAWAIVNSGKPLYRTLFFDGHVKFIYPTSSLLIYLIPTALHLNTARFIGWVVLLSLPGVLVVAGELFVLSSPPPGGETLGRLYCRILVGGIGLLFYPLVYGVYLGQIQTLLTFLWTLAAYFWLREKKGASAVCLALICAFKPTLAVFVLWALMRRQWRFLAWFTAVTAAIQVLAISRFGWQNEIDYLSVLAYMSRHGEAFIPNQSVNGLLQRLLGNGDRYTWSDHTYPPYNPTVYAGTLISSVVLMAFGLFAPLSARWKGGARDFILFGMIATIATPIVWEHHYGYFFAGCVYFLALRLRHLTTSFYLFTACFLVMANSWRLLDPLVATRWNLVLSLGLFAGLAFILLFTLSPTTPEEGLERTGGRASNGLAPTR